ncbi:MAG: flagellar biosynthesis anti-sigma factor FlgM [Rubrivivax sp.]|nr:MAG: flagellar biosynthesis anti-sigma factor FlgM [Rubrivivax sp.]
MKIGNSTDAVSSTSTARTDTATQTTRTPGKTGSLEGGVDASAKVTLSNVAGNLLTSTDGSFDAEKVSRIKQAIDNGTYKINADAIADKLINNAQELLSRR